MTTCACHCAACRAAGHGNQCVVLRIGLLRLFHGEADPVDLVLQHYYHGASGWDTARFDAAILSVQYGPAGDVIAAGDSNGHIHLICTQTGAKTYMGLPSLGRRWTQLGPASGGARPACRKPATAVANPHSTQAKRGAGWSSLDRPLGLAGDYVTAN